MDDDQLQHSDSTEKHFPLPGDEVGFDPIRLAANAQIRLLHFLADAVASDLVNRPPQHE